MGNFTVEPLFLKNASEALGADFYRPAKVRKPPVVIMAHGFAAERKFGLPEYASALASAGYAVVLFDYRGFGGSTGKPRELVSAPHHVADWKAVLAQVKKRKDIDPHNIVLWGISMSGGHVMTTAAREKGVAAIIALVPHVDGFASAMLYPKYALPRAMALAMQDLAGSKIGRDPIRIPVVAESGIRCFTGPDCYEGYMSMVPKGSSWVGLVPARIVLTVNQYRPTKEAQKIQCPALVIAAEKDSLIPISATRKAAAKIKQVEYLQWPIGHFELMQGRWFDESVKMQLAFLKKHIG
jgi:pimeloyl-ACP methyl ester carboxylesterase